MTAPLSVDVAGIYNLACPASPVHYQTDPVQTTRTCVVGALNMLELAMRLNVPVLQASTSEIYGDPAVHPQTENYHGNVNPVGPRLQPFDGRVISNFIMQALAGRDVTIYGDGSQTRSFCYVDDLIDGMIRMMDSHPKFDGPVNLGNPREMTIKELAETIITRTGSSSKLIYQSLPADDPLQRRPDISLAQRELGWEPKISLEEGLKKTIKPCLGLQPNGG